MEPESTDRKRIHVDGASKIAASENRKIRGPQNIEDSKSDVKRNHEPIELFQQDSFMPLIQKPQEVINDRNDAPAEKDRDQIMACPPP